MDALAAPSYNAIPASRPDTPSVKLDDFDMQQAAGESCETNRVLV